MLLTYLAKHNSSIGGGGRGEDKLRGQIHYDVASLHLVELSKQRTFPGDLGTTIKMMKY